MLDLSILWLSWTPPFRIAFLAFAITAVLLLFIKIFPKLTNNSLIVLLRLFIQTLKMAVIIFFGIVQTILILLFKIFGNKMDSINHSFDKVVAGLDKLFDRMDYKAKQIKIALGKRHVFSAAVLLALLVLSVMIKFPDSKPGMQLAGYDKTVNEYLNLEDISSTEAEELLSVWLDDLFGSDNAADAETGSYSEENESLDRLQLKAQFDGGNIRHEAGNGTVVTVLDPADFVYYLNNDITDINGDIWYEVETQQGQTGWISSGIVEFVE